MKHQSVDTLKPESKNAALPNQFTQSCSYCYTIHYYKKLRHLINLIFKFISINKYFLQFLAKYMYFTTAQLLALRYSAGEIFARIYFQQRINIVDPQTNPLRAIILLQTKTYGAVVT